jgi:hypothetical protein
LTGLSLVSSPILGKWLQNLTTCTHQNTTCELPASLAASCSESAMVLPHSSCGLHPQHTVEVTLALLAEICHHLSKTTLGKYLPTSLSAELSTYHSSEMLGGLKSYLSNTQCCTVTSMHRLLQANHVHLCPVLHH